VWRLLKELYSTVSNKVVLGNLESEWFNQDNGVNQGCILSQSLFFKYFPTTNTFDLFELNFKFHFLANEEAIVSIVCRSDSDSAIRATWSAYNNAFIIWEAIGTPILCSESISVRSFIITEKSDCDKIHPWFTPLSNESKVLVVGKYIDKSNKWVVGDTYIEETNEYKYNVPWSIFLSFS
jgi:hypothetical protein